MTVLKIPIKYQENTKKFGTEIPNRFGIGIFLPYQIFCYRLASLVFTSSIVRRSAIRCLVSPPSRDPLSRRRRLPPPPEVGRLPPPPKSAAARASHVTGTVQFAGGPLRPADQLNLPEMTPLHLSVLHSQD